MTSASHYITSASRYHPRYQSRSSRYIRDLIARNFAELADAVPIVITSWAGISIYFSRYSIDTSGKKSHRMEDK